jgi:hypothetical protein
MSFEVTVTPTVYNVEVEVNPSVQPFDVQVVANKDLSDLVNEAKQYADDAEDSADSASASEQASALSEANALASEQSASASASSALASAQASAQSAQDAEDAVNSLTFGDLTEASSSVLTITGGTDAVFGNGTSIQVKQASGSQSGFLSSSDWTAFNGKQEATGLSGSDLLSLIYAGL